MLRLLLTVFLVIVASFIYGYFRELNPGEISIRTSPSASYDLSPVSLVLLSMATGALIVTLLVGVRETKHSIANWRHTRLRRREEKGDALHREGTHAFLSKRTTEAIGLFQKALALDPNRIDSLLWLGNIYRAEKNYTEAIRLHRSARRLEERNVEVLLELAKDLEGAKRFEEALQTLQDILNLDQANLTASIRKRDLFIRLEQWGDALEIQHRLVKANLSEQDQRAETKLLAGITYEVGRQFLERGHPEKARRYFRGAIKRDRTFLPA
ncbi:MAG TPA: tetratricopeptide repeat protein, partial [Nitrospiraceae bacterium]|nr:tetratricopeptide repeat protein [Nitrospiraceae bacterium]